MATVSPPPTIRPAHPADLERIAWLEEAAFADPWPLTLLDYEFKHPRAVLLLASWGEAAPAAGYVAFRHGGGEAELLRLAVAPAERRLVRLVEAQRAHRSLGVGDVARTEGVVRLEREEAPVQPVGGGRRKAVVGRRLGRHSGHSTTALPWCQEGS